MRRYQPQGTLANPDKSSAGGVVEVMEELVKFTLRTRDVSRYLADRYSGRKERAQAPAKRVNQRSL